MDAQTLATAMGNAPGVNYAEQLPGCLAACREAALSTVNRRAMFLAQLGEESLGLSAPTEFADGSEYEARADLGNTQPGDGPRFKGRGWIQITGRANYGALSQWAFARRLVPTSTFFVDHPEQLATDAYVWLGPVWYWTTHGLNSYADAGDVEGATRVINGGLNGLAERERRWQACLALGTRLLDPQPDLLEELMALDPNSPDYKRLVADISTATADKVLNHPVPDPANPKVTRTLAQFIGYVADWVFAIKRKEQA